MVCGVIAGSIVEGPGVAAIIIFIVIVMAFVGLLDDFNDLRATPRLVLTLLGGGAIGVAVNNVSALPMALDGHVTLAAILGALWCTSVVNATNFMDGINGISGGVCVVAGLSYGMFGWHLEQAQLAILGFTIAGAALAFLPFNVPRARVFLGDVGSYGLGSAMGGASLLAVSAGAPLECALAPLGLYLADTGTTLLRRLFAGEAVFTAHRSHVYQRLTDAWGSHTIVSMLVATLSALVVAATSLAFYGSSGLRIAGVAVAAVLVVTYLSLPDLTRKVAP